MLVELGDIERASADAIAATDAVVLLEVDDTVGVLHDGAIGGTGGQTARLGAMHALVFAHQQHHGAVGAHVLVELDQVPIVPGRLRHGLITVLKDRFAEAITVPFEASHFAGLAADAGGGIHQLADLLLALDARAGRGAGVTGNAANV